MMAFIIHCYFLNPDRKSGPRAGHLETSRVIVYDREVRKDGVITDSQGMP
jgi:hypothetical protein